MMRKFEIEKVAEESHAVVAHLDLSANRNHPFTSTTALNPTELELTRWLRTLRTARTNFNHFYKRSQVPAPVVLNLENNGFSKINRITDVT